MLFWQFYVKNRLLQEVFNVYSYVEIFCNSVSIKKYTIRLLIYDLDIYFC